MSAQLLWCSSKSATFAVSSHKFPQPSSRLANLKQVGVSALSGDKYTVSLLDKQGGVAMYTAHVAGEGVTMLLTASRKLPVNSTIPSFLHPLPVSNHTPPTMPRLLSSRGGTPVVELVGQGVLSPLLPALEGTARSLAVDVGQVCGAVGAVAVGTQTGSVLLARCPVQGAHVLDDISSEHRQPVAAIQFHSSQPMLVSADSHEGLVYRIESLNGELRLLLLARASIYPPVLRKLLPLMSNTALCESESVKSSDVCSGRVDMLAGLTGAAAMVISHNTATRAALYIFSGQEAPSDPSGFNKDSWTFSNAYVLPEPVQCCCALDDSRMLVVSGQKLLLLQLRNEQFAIVESCNVPDLSPLLQPPACISCITPLPPARSTVVLGLADGSALLLHTAPPPR